MHTFAIFYSVQLLTFKESVNKINSIGQNNVACNHKRL